MVSGNHHKIGPASMVHPNAAPICAPAVSFGARGIAMLRRHPDFCASHIDAAGMPSHVIGVARNRLLVSVVSPIAIVIAVGAALIRKVVVPRDRKVGSASVVHPNASFVGAPTVAFGASGVAVLRQQSYSASRVKRARVPSLIIGVARNRLRIPVVLPIAIVVPVRIPIYTGVLIRVVSDVAHREISAASVIYPNPAVIRAPTVAFGAGGVAALRCHTHSASYVHGTGVSSHIVGVAGNRGLALRFLGDD